jgi:hypothetical protein
MHQKEKLNESIGAIHELNVCNESISYLRGENAMLKSKIHELNVCKPSTSSVDHVTICTRCRYVNVDAIHDHLALVKQQNDHIAQLTAKINEHEIENKILNLLETCSIMGDALASRMTLVSNREAMSNLMPPKDCLILLRARLPWIRITMVTFYILLVTLSTRLGEFMLKNLILFPIMLLCIRMMLLALGILLMLKCLKRKLILHQMNLMFHLRLLMLLMCLLTNQAK